MATQTVRLVEPGYVDAALADKADLFGGKVPTAQLPDAFVSVAPTVVTIPYTATITPNAALGTTQRCSLNGNVTVAPPTNPLDGELLLFRFASAGGARQVTFSTAAGGFAFGNTVPSIPIGVSGKAQYIGCTFNASTGKWDIISYADGYAS